jgi:hypothetical protein
VITGDVAPLQTVMSGVHQRCICFPIIVSLSFLICQMLIKAPESIFDIHILFSGFHNMYLTLSKNPQKLVLR